MSEKIVMVVGSSANAGEGQYASNYFWVIDFSNPGAPSPVQVLLPFEGSGCVVDCSGTLAAVGNFTESSVLIYDISTPAVPRLIGSCSPYLGSTSFDGIGAISFYAGYVLAAEANGNRVALIEIGSAYPPAFEAAETSLTTVSDVAVFGEYVVVCGTYGDNSISYFQVTNVKNLSSIAGTESYPLQSEGPVTCDFDGTNAVFSDGSVFGISDGTPTANPVTVSSAAGGALTSVTIAESQNANGEYSGGAMIANAGSNSLTVDLSFLIPVTSEANQFTDSASLGEPVGIEGLIDAYGGVAKFSRTIFGTSALLAAAGVTENASGAQESVVTLFKVSTAFSGGTGSITVTQEGQRATVPLPNGQATLGIATFYTFPEPPFPFPHPIPHPIEGL